MENVMVDLETLDCIPGGVILSIGAVEFDPTGVMGRRFYQVVSIYSCQRYGLTIGADTYSWWMNQDKDARQVLDEAGEPLALPLKDVLRSFNAWLDDWSDVKVWGNGSDFDNAFLQVAYKRAGIPVPWKFWHNRCFRTLKTLHPGFKRLEPPRTGTKHNALDDAVHQARWAMRIYQALMDGGQPALPPAEPDKVWDGSKTMTEPSPKMQQVVVHEGPPPVDFADASKYNVAKDWPVCAVCGKPKAATLTGIECPDHG